MRQVDPKIAKERKEKILHAVIHHYIKTAHPVSSNILNEDYGFDMSSATIRNIMAELEDEGFLTHPHTSAGRTPTDKGYRTYVDSLMELQRLVLDEEERVRSEYDDRIREMQDLLVRTSRILSGLSQYSGFVLAPKMETNLLKYIELIHLAESKVLVVMVTQSGMVKHKVIEANLPRERLAELSRILNAKLRGLTLLEAKQRIIDEIEESERQHREILALARSLSSEVFEIEDELYLGGTSNVLSLPEFQDYGPMRSILRLNDDRELLRQILDMEEEKDTGKDGVRVMIGSENHLLELKDLSVISTIYRNGDAPVGILGIIGPKRMEYPKMMALVGAVSKMVGKFLSRMGG